MQRQIILTPLLSLTMLACTAWAQQDNPGGPVRPAGPREQWRSLYVGGINVGYVHNEVKTIDRDGVQVVVNSQTVVMSVGLPRERGSVVSPEDTRSKIMMESEELTDGELIAFRYQVESPPVLAVRKEGRVTDDGKLEIVTEAKGKITKRIAELPVGVKGPAFADRIMLDNPLKPNEVRTVTTLDPRSASVDQIRFEARDLENVLMRDGTEKRLLHVVATHSIAPGTVFHEFLDESGDSWKTTVPNQEMVIYTTTEKEALKPFTVAELP